jgi:hypothetical protein
MSLVADNPAQLAILAQEGKWSPLLPGLPRLRRLGL